MSRSSVLLGAALAGLLVTIGLFWSSEIPLGIPGEWTWERTVADADQRLDLALGMFSALMVLAIYVVVAWAGRRRISYGSPQEVAAWLGALVVAGFCWLWAVQESPPAEYRLQKVAWVLYYPGSSGYFYEARYHMEDVSSFLRDYEDKMAEGDVLHVGTHPPGLFLMHRGLIRWCQSSPTLSRILLDSQPESVREAFDIIAENSRHSATPLLEIDRATIWAAGLLTQLLAVATLIPLYLLLRRSQSRAVSWQAVVFWPLVPAVAVFLPKSDALYPIVGVLFLVTWLSGWRRNSWGLCLSAGVLFWFGMLFSLAMLPIGALAAFLTLWEFRAERILSRRASASSADPPACSSLRAIETRNLLLCIALAAVGFILGTVAFWWVWDLNLVNVWWWNYRNHAGFYDQFSRTYWKWLLVNPFELAFATGLPLFILMLVSGRQTLRAALRQVPELFGERIGQRLPSAESAADSKNSPGNVSRPLLHRPVGVLLCCAAVWGLLWISGKNMGEAARLWLILLPWSVWLSATCWNSEFTDRLPSHGPASGRKSKRQSDSMTGRLEHFASERLWLTIVAVQGLACLMTVTRVNGFHFGGF